jgi:hypothetical protein
MILLKMTISTMHDRKLPFAIPTSGKCIDDQADYPAAATANGVFYLIHKQANMRTLGCGTIIIHVFFTRVVFF